MIVAWLQLPIFSVYKALIIPSLMLSTGGYIFLSCNTPEEASEPPFHLVLDYLTDAVLKTSDVGGGNIYLSPDSRNVIISASEGSAVSVYKITADGKNIVNQRFKVYKTCLWKKLYTI